MTKTVYLAGSITGMKYGEANDWRNEAIERLAKSGIIGVSPLRCEPLRGDTYTPTSADPKFGTARAIASKNMMDVKTCDLTLCYMPVALNENWPSVGTILELGWAHALGKPTILVTDHPRLVDHPVVQVNAGWILGTLEEAYEVIEGIYGVYCAVH